MANKYTLFNNKLITNSANLVRNSRLGGRALVVSGNITNELLEVRLTDFFDIVIAESIDARNKLGFADMLFYSDASAYRGGTFVMNECKGWSDTIIMTNFGAIKDLTKLKRDLDIYNLNYVPTQCACISAPGGPLQNELNADALGVHLALILGCTTIYADRYIANSIYMDSAQLKKFMTDKSTKGFLPMNLLKTGRFPFLKAAF